MLLSTLLSLGVASSALASSSPVHSSVSRISAREVKKPVAATWFASWHANKFPLTKLSWNKYTAVMYSFAQTTSNYDFVDITDQAVFKDFVSTAHSHDVSAILSIGGWTGSRFFSSAIASTENRTAFVKKLASVLNDNCLDGFDFDWEYPNAAGIGCNTKSPNDTANFLLFLKELRTALPHATLSAATSLVPWAAADGNPSTSLSEFASVLDYIQIMNYDVWGPWSPFAGPNAPLDDTCAADATRKAGSAVSAVAAWTKAGFLADQIVLGVPAYGHGFDVKPDDALTYGALNSYPVFNKSSTPAGDAWDDGKGTLDVCGAVQAQGGTWNFWGLIKGGFLTEQGGPAEGIAYTYDNCSQTPSVYNKKTGVFVAFDNAGSFTAKGKFIHDRKLRGFSMWEAGGDYKDILLDAIRSGAEFPKVGGGYHDGTGNSGGAYNSGGSGGSPGTCNAGSGNSSGGYNSGSGQPTPIPSSPYGPEPSASTAVPPSPSEPPYGQPTDGPSPLPSGSGNSSGGYQPTDVPSPSPLPSDSGNSSGGYNSNSGQPTPIPSSYGPESSAPTGVPPSPSEPPYGQPTDKPSPPPYSAY